MSEISFNGYNQYYVSLMLNLDMYNYAKVTATITQQGSRNIYKINRVMKYNNAFIGIRENVTAGNMAMYNELFKTVNDLMGGSSANYYCVNIINKNNLEYKYLDYNAYIVQSTSDAELLNSAEFNSLPHVTDENYIAIVFNLGLLNYDEMVESRITRMAYSIRAYKPPVNTIQIYKMPDDETYNPNSTKHKNYNIDLFYGDNISDYMVGISNRLRY